MQVLVYVCEQDLHAHLHRDLETPSQSINALLLKYARVSTGQNGVKLFNSKRPLY